MTVFVNDTEVAIDSAATLQAVLDSASIKSFNGIAIAVNNEVIPKTELEKTIVKDKDKILVIRAFQGG
jgi:sulfur carrier protein